MKMFVEPPAIYLYKQPVDFRKSINGLSAIVEAEMDRSPFSGAVFVFCNRRRDKVRALYWDKTGFCLWYKRTAMAVVARGPRYYPDERPSAIAF